MIAALAARYWQVILGAAVSLALIVGLLATRATLATTKAERDTATIKLSVSNASVGRMEAEMKRVMESEQSLAASDSARIQASRETLAVAEAASKVRQAAIERLKASAAVLRPDAPHVPECEVSDAVAEAWPL